MRYVLVSLFIFISGHADAQTWNEWFRQKETRLKYLLEQLGALKAYAGVVQEGYAIAREGLSFIHLSRERDFHMHGQHFASLLTVNPTIKQNGIAGQAAALLEQNRLVVQRTIRQAQQSGVFSPGELDYMSRAFNHLLREGSEEAGEAQQLSTDNVLSLDDRQRLYRLGALYISMQERYEFTRKMAADCTRLALLRIKEKSGNTSLSKLYMPHSK